MSANRRIHTRLWIEELERRIAPAAGPSIVYSQDFSTGKPSENWSYYTSGKGGQIQVVDGALRMDSKSGNSLNEAVLCVNLAGLSDVTLEFQHRDSKDEIDAMPAGIWSGHRNGDGVTISSDGGATWYSIASLGREESWATHKIDLDAIIAAAGMSYTANFQIKFQQYDNQQWGVDGREFDNVTVRGSRPVPPADYIDCSQNFSSSKPGKAEGWEYYSSNASGQIRVVNGALRMDSNLGVYCLNEAILSLDLEGKSNIKLQFKHRDSLDEPDPMPTGTWTGHRNGDGVAISSDGGATWYSILSLGRNTDWKTYTIDLDQAVAMAGMSYTSNLQIKFQQYDNQWWSLDGREFDDIAIRVSRPAPIDYSQDFSSGKPGETAGWQYYSSYGGSGIQVVNSALRMDSNGAYCLNEAILTLNLAGQTNVQLQFAHRDSLDETDPMPGKGVNWASPHQNGDGVAISNDGGITWRTVLSLGRETNWTIHTIDLDKEAAIAGMGYTANFQIKFQQYDNQWWGLDGREFDDIYIRAV